MYSEAQKKGQRQIDLDLILKNLLAKCETIETTKREIINKVKE
jgi:7,8-dihydro-6-hydroxymethylpterin-pyrophosphokinase